MVPGSTTHVKWSDYQQGYIPRSELQTHQTQAVQNFLKTIAQAKGRRPQGQGQGQGQGNGQQRQQPVDFFGDVREMPFIDGKSLATLGERIQREGIAPLYEWASKVNGYLQQLQKQVQNQGRVAGSLSEERQRGEFTQKMSAAVTALAKKALPGVDVSAHPVINEFAQDIYLSYDPTDPNLEREFPQLLESRLDGLMKLASALSQAKLAAAKEQHRAFLKPGGAGQPSGQGGAPRLSNREIARNFFAASGNT